jgi:N-acylglucosamine 2-epimerase
MNPGHAIEAGWFVYQYALRQSNQELQQLAINMIEWSFEIGWDKEHGGLYYFLDSDGRSPPYLEWNMKLWWPHCEALVAYAMLYRHTRNPHYWTRFQLILDYTLIHFSDSANYGEWFGYLDREGRVTHRFKGGPYKGCFHVPRALFLVAEQLRGVAA